MKWQLALSCALLALPGSLFAQEKEPAADKQLELKTVKDRASYAFGLNIGRSIARDKLDVSAELIAAGIRDAVLGREPLLSDEELQAAIQAFQQELAAQQAERQQAEAVNNQEAGEAFLAANKKKEGVKTLESGLQYQVLKSGDGPSPKATDTVKTHYHGTLIDGTVFDSSVKRGEPATFPVNRVIKGWTEALQLMQVGDKWRLFIPSDLAYGAQGSQGAIGPNSTLIFEVELLGIEE